MARVSFREVAAHARIEEEETRKVDYSEVVFAWEVLGGCLEVGCDGGEGIWDWDVCRRSGAVVAGLEELDQGGYCRTLVVRGYLRADFLQRRYFFVQDVLRDNPLKTGEVQFPMRMLVHLNQQPYIPA